MNELIGLVGQRMMGSNRRVRIELDRLRKREPDRRIVRIARGVYFDATDLSADSPIWVVQRIVTIARAFALSMQFGDGVRMILTGEGAGKTLGLDTWWENPDMLFRADSPRKRKRMLPAVRINEHRVDGVWAEHVTGGVQTTLKDCAFTDGLHFAPPPVMIADSARREHVLQAFVLACMLLTQLANVDRFYPDAGRRHAEKLRKEWVKKADVIEGARAYRILLAVLGTMQAAMDSPLEAAMLWLMDCVLSWRRTKTITNQHRVDAATGNVWFLDFAFPDLKIGLEGDGKVKYGSTTKEALAYGSKHTNRHQELMDAGWTIRHVTMADVATADSHHRIHGHLQKLGAVQSRRGLHLRGPIYQPPRVDLHGRSRCT